MAGRLRVHAQQTALFLGSQRLQGDFIGHGMTDIGGVDLVTTQKIDLEVEDAEHQVDRSAKLLRSSLDARPRPSDRQNALFLIPRP